MPNVLHPDLSKPDLEELKQEVGFQLENDVSNRDYWKAVNTIVSDRLKHLSITISNIHSGILSEIETMLSDKSYMELCELGDAVKVQACCCCVISHVKLADPTLIDPEYWSLMSARIDVYKAKTMVVECHQKSLATLKQYLEKHPKPVVQPSTAPALNIKPKRKEVFPPTEETLMMFDDPVVYFDDDAEDIEIELFEEDFGEDNVVPWRQDIVGGNYKPLKPTFANRVIVGFEWHTYNKTHYDVDNPPPRIVQGYKFNIFYPDLIDKTNTPSYKVTQTREESMANVTTLVFHGGPPYEDLAFRIVDREWDIGRGVCCLECSFHHQASRQRLREVY